MSSFPLIFAISKDKDITVENAFEGGRFWNVEVKRNLQDWEVEEYENLLQTLATILLSKKEDKLRSNLMKNGNFTVNSFYRFLNGYSPTNQLKFPTKLIWNTQAPPRISFFA